MHLIQNTEFSDFFNKKNTDSSQMTDKLMLHFKNSVLKKGEII